MSQLYNVVSSIFYVEYSYRPESYKVIIFPSKTEPCAGAIVILHGWGANCRDLVSLADSLTTNGFRFLFPEGPFDVPGTSGEGKGWFAFPPTESFETERQKSRSEIFQILDDLKREGVPSDRIFLIGFSQGASMCLDVALNYKHRVAGVAVLSGFLMDQEILPDRNDLPISLPIFWGHGLYDPLIPIKLGKQSRHALVDAGFHVEWHEYPMAHQIVPEELEDVRQFLDELFPNSDKAVRQLPARHRQSGGTDPCGKS